MSLINTVFQQIFKKRLHEIGQFAKFPFEIQEGQLKMLLKVSQNTEWGKKFNFYSVKSIEDYQKKVPLQKYEEARIQIDRTRQGEQNILWPENIKWFAKSSGTTDDKSKFIPVSKASLHNCHFKGGKDVIILYLNNYPKSRIFTGKTLTVGGSHQIDICKNAHSGDLSAIIIQNIPFWADIFRTPPAKIALISQWEKKLEKLIPYVLKQNITALAGVPSWNLVMIKNILESTSKKNLLEIWPHLELFLHGGVNFAPYKEQYLKYIPDENMHYMETFNASEGFFAIQDLPGNQGMLLMLDYGIFYEFIPLDEFNNYLPKTLHIGEVKTGINYAVVITTNGGLWRYIPGDTVMFTSIYPHKIVITGRTKHFINAFGEEVIIDNAEKAIQEACNITGALIYEYTAAPVYMSENTKGCHEWLIEFVKAPENMENFITLLDETLMKLNSDYEAKRYKNITLDVPIVKSLKKGVFYKWFSEKGKLGGQNKIPRLSNNRKYVEELLKINEMV